MLQRAGLADDPLARMAGKQFRHLETMAGRLEAHVERRGMFRKTGELRPLTKLVDVDRHLGEARRLLEGLQRHAPPEPTRLEFSAFLGDGRELHVETAQTGPEPAPRTERRERAVMEPMLNDILSDPDSLGSVGLPPLASEARAVAGVFGPQRHSESHFNGYLPPKGSGSGPGNNRAVVASRRCRDAARTRAAQTFPR